MISVGIDRIPVWLIDATLHDLGLSDFDLDQMPLQPTPSSGQDAGDKR